MLRILAIAFNLFWFSIIPIAAYYRVDWSSLSLDAIVLSYFGGAGLVIFGFNLINLLDSKKGKSHDGSGNADAAPSR